jgi:U5 small nuclear ribonucleoprotein component
MDADLYDEFGNYIGPDLDDSDDELADQDSDGSADHDAVDDDPNDADVCIL